MYLSLSITDIDLTYSETELMGWVKNVSIFGAKNGYDYTKRDKSNGKLQKFIILTWNIMRELYKIDILGSMGES